MKRKIVILFTLLTVASICLTLCACGNKESAALSCKGATANGYDMYLEVDKDVEYVDLSKMINASAGVDWKVYKDPECWYETDREVVLSAGKNVVYISTSFAGYSMKVYTLTIFRHHTVDINYFVGNQLYKTDTVPTDEMYFVNASYTPQTDGREFDCWTDESGKKKINFMPKEDTSLFANFTAHTYTATLSDGQSNLSEYKAVYGEPLTLPVPENKYGYDFTGWSYQGKTVTNEHGMCTKWTIASDATLTPQWIAKKFTVSITNDKSNYGGEISGAGQYSYGQTISLRATTNSASVFNGWYENETLLSRDLTYSFTMPANNVQIQARWARLNVTVNNSNAGSIITSGENIVGKEINLYVNDTTNGYTWIGWFNGDTLLSDQKNYSFFASEKDTTITAKWVKFCVSLATENASLRYCTYTSGWKDYGSEPFAVTAGETVQLSAMPKKYMPLSFVGWYSDDTLVSSRSDYSFTMPAKNVNLRAVWTTYYLNIVCPEGIDESFATKTQITESSNTNSDDREAIVAGHKVEISINENNNTSYYTSNTPTYIWGGWYKDGELLTKDISYEFTMPHSDITFTANWLDILHFNANIDEYGLISFQGYAIIGRSFKLRANYCTGYDFDGWYKDGVLISNERELTIIVTEDGGNYEARFSPIDAPENTE